MSTRGFIRTTLLSFAALYAVGFGLPAWAQPANVTTGKAVHHDTSRRLDHLPAGIPGRGGENRQIPNKARVLPPRFPDLAEPDGGVQTQASGPSQQGPTPGPTVSAPGLSEQDNYSTLGYGVVPPDINGDIGLDDSGNRIFIQYINSIWAVFDVNGNKIAGPLKGNSFWQGFGGYCQTNNDGDPVVLYDDQAGRWVFSQFSIGEGVQCMAVSITSDPLGEYHRYAFEVSPGKQNDYPKLGVWTDGGGQSAYTFTTRDFPCCSSGFMGSGVMERDQMLVGGPAKFVKIVNACVNNECIEGQLPPHLAGSPPPAGTCPTFWTAVDAAYDDSPYANDGYRNHTLCIDWSNLNNTTYTEGTFVPAGSNFDRSLGNISPVYGGEQLNSLPYFTMYRAQYRWFGGYGSVVLNTTVDAGSERAGIRWAETRSIDGDSSWYLAQDGTYAPEDGLERWMGSIAQDGDGNIALGYTVTGSSLFPSIRYNTRMAGDPAGTLPGGEVSCHEGTGAQAAGSGNRWGDYSSMSIDPTDDCTFWYTQEYYETTGSFDFNTRICSFRIAGCGGASFNNPPQVTITEPADGSEYEIGALVQFSATASDYEDGDLGASIDWLLANDVFGTGETVVLDTSGLAPGSHQVIASVNDNDPSPKTGSDSVQITLVEAPASVHVASVITGTQNASRGKKYGTATVTIVNNLGQPAQGYTVSGDFGGSFSGESAIEGPTDSDGRITLQTTSNQKSPTVTVCVSNVAGGALEYIWEDSAPETTCGAPPDPQPPVVTITGPADGSNILEGAAVTFTAGADDPELGDISADISWTLDGNAFGNGPSVTTSSLTLGDYTVAALVIDETGLSDSDSIVVHVVETLPTVVMHIGDLDGGSAAGRPGRWDASVTVTVHNADHNPVSGATVSGAWSGGANGGASCPTDGNGQCQVSKSNLKTNVGNVTFGVTGITRDTGDTYAAGTNHEPDGDSNGSTITVSQ